MTELLDAARDLRTVLDAEGAKAEAEGTPMTDEAVKLCREAGFYDTLIPKDVGGAELTFNESLDVFTELARADGSIGWVVMAGSTAACYFGSWSPASFSDVMFADGVPLVAGQFAPNGTAVPGPDGYHITAAIPLDLACNTPNGLDADLSAPPLKATLISCWPSCRWRRLTSSAIGMSWAFARQRLMTTPSTASCPKTARSHSSASPNIAADLPTTSACCASPKSATPVGV